MKGRTRKQQIGIITAMIVGVFAISIGFAAFSSTLNIRSSATVNPDASSFAVIFSKDGNSIDATQTVNPSSDTYGEDATITNGTSPVIGGLKAKFTVPGQSVSYSFYAKNTGSFDAYLNYITFLNVENATSNKVCTASNGTDQTMVDSACNGISISVKVGADAAVTTSQAGITNHVLGRNTKEQVIITITYAENSAVADGTFDVTFGDISLIYSTVSDYVVESSTVCKPVETATLGNVPAGNYAAGDEYTCDPGDGIERTFYILNTSGDNVNLIMANNLAKSAWITKSDYLANNGDESKWIEATTETECVNVNNPYLNTSMGPITALNTLNNNTSTWDNITNLNESHTDKNNLYTIQLTGKARLPKYSEISGLGCKDEWGAEESCPIWLAGNYWLMDTLTSTNTCDPDVYQGYSYMVYAMLSAGEDDFSAYGIQYTYTADPTANVRPVITVSKDQIG